MGNKLSLAPSLDSALFLTVMIIRAGKSKDFKKLYKLGKVTPELKVSNSLDFMDPDEFLWAIKNPKGVFLIAEVNSKIAGFIYASTSDFERSLSKNWACLVYVVVDKKYRKKGIASKLYKACIKKLKAKGITNIYAWANIESDGAIAKFMKKKRFVKGHKYVWMDKKI
ncbi:MAG: BzdT protein [Candidatus Nomurabacteria bacterium GW2011_GWA1_46_11]|uniref:BzdT protein n=2 Tax=Parcubacteria group TaxID=1794811 RepID=A0A0G1QXI1_9BACT|nr:MAG: BzdT protein [Candidatus Nomurabacteria bacterium GW2011_GWA1_46_11]